MAYKRLSPQPVIEGGTGQATLGLNGVIYGNTLSGVGVTNAGATGTVLAGNTGSAPTFQAFSGLGVTSVSGGNNITISGTATAPIVNVSGTNQYSLLIGNATGSISSLSAVGATNGQIPIGAGVGANPTLATLTAGTGVSIVNSAGAITINTIGGGFVWIVETISSAMAINTGYIANGSGTVLTFTLPAAAVEGSVIRVTGLAAVSNGWIIAQNANQLIEFGTGTTTTGIGGSLASTNGTDSVELVCAIANTTWIAISAVGNITVT